MIVDLAEGARTREGTAQALAIRQTDLKVNAAWLISGGLRRHTRALRPKLLRRTGLLLLSALLLFGEALLFEYSQLLLLYLPGLGLLLAHLIHQHALLQFLLLLLPEHSALPRLLLSLGNENRLRKKVILRSLHACRGLRGIARLQCHRQVRVVHRIVHCVIFAHQQARRHAAVKILSWTRRRAWPCREAKGVLADETWRNSSKASQSVLRRDSLWRVGTLARSGLTQPLLLLHARDSQSLLKHVVLHWIHPTSRLCAEACLDGSSQVPVHGLRAANAKWRRGRGISGWPVRHCAAIGEVPVFRHGISLHGDGLP
mmetsp:Transcript_54132/g.116901  ORF Transcript_54132/g.116901 Transcript_54132/m.116901 type:complete len:315 (+) Transcript_54132:262-1206(+)